MFKERSNGKKSNELSQLKSLVAILTILISSSIATSMTFDSSEMLDSSSLSLPIPSGFGSAVAVADMNNDGILKKINPK